MKLVIKLLLYYFLSQLCATTLAMAGYFGWQYVDKGAFVFENGLPIGYALAANIASILFMLWIILKDKCFVINKESIYPGKPINIIIYSSIGLTAMIWLNFLSDILSLPDWFKSTFSMMQENTVGIITMAVIAPIFEEVLFRGAIEGHLLRKWKNPRYAILVSALIFGVIHLNPAQMLFAFLFGLILGELYYRTGSITPSTILHFINNTISVVLMLIFPEDDTLTELFGFNTMAILSVVCLVASILLIREFIKRYPHSLLKDNLQE